MIYLSLTFFCYLTQCDTDDKWEKADPELVMDHFLQSVCGGFVS